MLKNTKKIKSEGFTLIEVLIVLAIAGLIMVVVFLAVPALQRSQRNNGRASEASRFSSAIGNFVSNNQGNPPANAADVTSIINDFGGFKYLAGISATGNSTNTTITAGAVSIIPQASYVRGTIAADGMAIVTGGKCNGPSQSTTVALGKTTQIALLYTTETSGANFNEICIQAQ